MNKVDIERMVQESQCNASEGIHRRETIQARNGADKGIYKAEKSLKGMSEKVSAPEQEKTMAKITELKITIAGEDSKKIRRQITDLQQAMYNSTKPNGTDRQEHAGRNGHKATSTEDVVEGELHNL